jgi:cytochrome c biogenesis protein
MPAAVRALLNEFGKMRTAVFLLAVSALASVLATWIPQSLPAQDYVAKYGYATAKTLMLIGLTDVVRAWWFVGIFGFLLLSVSVCIWRNGYGALRTIGMIWVTQLWRTSSVDRLRLCRKAGYLLVHSGVLMVAAGALLTGLVGWRGVMNLREGESDNVVLSFHGNTATPHMLPFKVANRGFTVEQFATGMPRRFATELETQMAGGGKRYVAEVNAPAHIRGYTFYQAGFGDGGSTIKADGVSLSDGALVPFEGKVHEAARLADGTRIELLDFRANTVESLFDEHGRRLPPVDVGPSLDYLVQPPDAGARQLRSYLMHPAVLGVAERANNEGAAVYTPVWLGVVEPQLWPVVARLAAMKVDDFTTGDGLAAFKQTAAPVLQTLPEGRRVEAGLGVLQAVKMVREAGLTHLIFARDFTLRRYSGLQVAYDPGASTFWIGALLGLIGVMLMVFTNRRT